MDVKRFVFLVVLLLLAGQSFAQQSVTESGLLSAASTDCTTANSCVVLMMSPNSGGAAIRLAGTSSQTVQFEATVDGVGWTSITGVPIPSSAAVSSASAAGTWQFGTAGLAGIRARTSSYVSGGFRAILQSSASSPGVGGGGGGASTIANGSDVAEGTTTDTANCNVDTTAATMIGLTKCLSYLLQTAVGPTTAAGSNPFVQTYNTLVKGSITSAMTGTTSTSLISGTASNYLYITQCTTSNASTTVSTDIILQDGNGGTTLYNLPAPAAAVATTGGGGGAFTFPMPLKVPTSGNALYAANVTTGSSTKISCSGFQSTVSY